MSFTILQIFPFQHTSVQLVILHLEMESLLLQMKGMTKNIFHALFKHGCAKVWCKPKKKEELNKTGTMDARPFSRFSRCLSLEIGRVVIIIVHVHKCPLCESIRCVYSFCIWHFIVSSHELELRTQKYPAEAERSINASKRCTHQSF